LIIGNQQSATTLGKGYFTIVGSLEADSKRLYWYSCKGNLVVPKVNLRNFTKPTRAFIRSIVLKDWLWHIPKLVVTVRKKLTSKCSWSLRCKT